MRISVRAIVINNDKLLVMERNKFGHQYLSLIGGEVEIGEKLEDALYREVLEESSINIANPRLVIDEGAGEIYGRQYIYLCDYVSGEPKLDPNSIEIKISAAGKNTYKPRWVSLNDLPSSKMLPHELKETLLKFLNEGFPDKPYSLSIAPDSQL